MASLLRLGSRALARCSRHSAPSSSPLALQARCMGGSPFEGEPPTTTLGGAFKNPIGTGHASQEEISQWVKKELEHGWQSKGYDFYDEKTDNEYHQLMMFILVSCPLLMIAIWAYLPDRRMRDWAIREAYLVIKEREAAGVEPVSKDYVDPEKILANLPSDEELVKAGVVINI